MSDKDNLKILNTLLINISKINHQLIASGDEKKLCQKICNYLIKIKDYKLVCIDLKENGNDILTPVAVAGKDKDFTKSIKNSWNKYIFNNHPAGMALKSGKHFIIKDLKNTERFVPWDKKAIENGLSSALLLPIKYSNYIIGTLHIYSDIKNCFTEEVLFLKNVAREIGLGIKSAKSERELKDSKKEYEELFKKISSCIAIYEATDNGNDFIFKDFNNAAERADKLKRKYIIGKRVSDVFPGIRDFGLFDVFKRVFKTGIPESHPVSIYKDNRISGWRENFIYRLPNGDIVAVYNDLTEKKQAEEELLLANDRLTFAQKSANAAVWDWDIISNQAYLSPEYYDLFGFDPEKDTVTFDTWRNVLHPEDKQRIERMADDLARKKHEPHSFEFRIVLPSGEVRWIKTMGDTIYNGYGKAVRMSGICLDITDLKKTEDLLRIERKRLADILEGTNVGTWEWNIQTGETIFNERWANIIGYTLDEISPVSIETWERFCHPVDLERSNEQLSRIFSRDMDYYDIECRMKHKNGNWVWVQDRGKEYHGLLKGSHSG